MTDTHPTTFSEKLLLKPEEAANILSIGRTKLYQLIADGVLPSVRIGGSRRISWAALHDLVSRLANGQPTETPPPTAHAASP